MSQRFLILILALLIFNSNSLILEHDHKLVINSSYYKDVISVSISSYIQSQSQDNAGYFFNIKSNQLFQTTESIKFTHQLENFSIMPPINTENILYNDITDGEHWFGLKKYLKLPENRQNLVQKSFLLVSAQSMHSDNEQYFILPLMRMPTTALNLQNFVKCDEVLIGLDQSKGFDDLIIFSKAYNNIRVQGEWQWQLFNSFSQSKQQSQMKNIYYNRFRRSILSQVIRVRIIGQQAKLCNIIAEQMKQKRPFELLQSLDLTSRQLMTLQQVFDVVDHVLPVKKLKPHVDYDTEL